MGSIGCEHGHKEPCSLCQEMVAYERLHARAEKAEAERDRAYRLRLESARIAYQAGHNDTVEGGYGDPGEVARDICEEIDIENDAFVESFEGLESLRAKCDRYRAALSDCVAMLADADGADGVTAAVLAKHGLRATAGGLGEPQGRTYKIVALDPEAL